MQNMGSCLKHGFAWSYFFSELCDFVRLISYTDFMLNRKTLMFYACDEMWDVCGLVYILIWAEMLIDLLQKWAAFKWARCTISHAIFHEQKLLGHMQMGPNWPNCLMPLHRPHQHPCGTMSSPLSMSLPCYQPCHRICQRTRHPSCHLCMTWQLNPWWCLWCLFSS